MTVNAGQSRVYHHVYFYVCIIGSTILLTFGTHVHYSSIAISF